jgi:uncharacterized protein YceH (UPF0502 family)
MTLNSLLGACNQKTNREPVMELGESELVEALDGLVEKTLASTWQSPRNRTVKYQHRLHQRVFDEFNFSMPELAVLAVLFLRGPQTLGEIRSRCARIHEFQDMEAVTEVLKGLEQNTHGPYVAMLPRQAGRKESRFAHLFCGEVESGGAIDGELAASPAGGGSRIDELEREVTELREQLGKLEDRFEEFVKQFE